MTGRRASGAFATRRARPVHPSIVGEPIPLLLVEDHLLLGRALRRRISSLADVAVTVCTTATAAIREIERSAFALVIVDLALEVAPMPRVVLFHLMRGRRREEIARILGVTSETVRSHVASLYERLAVHSLDELILRTAAPAFRSA